MVPPALPRHDLAERVRDGSGVLVRKDVDRRLDLFDASVPDKAGNGQKRKLYPKVHEHPKSYERNQPQRRMGASAASGSSFPGRGPQAIRGEGGAEVRLKRGPSPPLRSSANFGGGAINLLRVRGARLCSLDAPTDRQCANETTATGGYSLGQRPPRRRRHRRGRERGREGGSGQLATRRRHRSAHARRNRTAGTPTSPTATPSVARQDAAAVTGPASDKVPAVREPAPPGALSKRPDLSRGAAMAIVELGV